MEIYTPFIVLAIAIAISTLAKREWLGPFIFALFIIPYTIYSKIDATIPLILSGIILLIHAAILYRKKNSVH